MEETRQKNMEKTVKKVEEHCEIAIIGAGLTGLTTAFRLHQKGRKVHVIEQADHIGGVMQTYHVDGFTMESGPNTGVVSYPEVAELFEDLKEDCRLETARESAKRRLIWKGNRFHALPSGLVSGIRTPLFSFADKIRLLGEPFRSKGTEPNETVADLVVRRMGKSFLNYAVDPFLSGIYAGNPHTLITRYALPKLYNLEQNYGSFIKGGIAKAKETKSERDRLATKKVFSAQGGQSQLVKALGKGIGANNITTHAQNVVVRPTKAGFQVEYADKNGTIHTLNCHKVVTTCGAYALPTLLPFVESALMARVNNLHYAPVIQVSVGINDTKGVELNAFGGLIPSCEHQKMLGILYPSACFENRCPEHGALLSFFMGGVRHPEYLEMSDNELTAIVEDALHRMLKFPESVGIAALRIFRHEHAIPQYEKNSGDRFAAIDELQKLYPGLIIGGNLHGGIGMADRIKQATNIAAQL